MSIRSPQISKGSLYDEILARQEKLNTHDHQARRRYFGTKSKKVQTHQSQVFGIYAKDIKLKSDRKKRAIYYKNIKGK